MNLQVHVCTIVAFPEGREYSKGIKSVVDAESSKCADIGLSMVSAKQQWDTRFILVSAVGHTSSRCALVVLYCKAPWCS
jgi:hypothetical protein